MLEFSSTVLPAPSPYLRSGLQPVNIGLFTARPRDKLQTVVRGGKSWRQLRYSPGHTHDNDDDMSGPVRAIAQMCVVCLCLCEWSD